MRYFSLFITSPKTDHENSSAYIDALTEHKIELYMSIASYDIS